MIYTQLHIQIGPYPAAPKNMCPTMECHIARLWDINLGREIANEETDSKHELNNLFSI